MSPAALGRRPQAGEIVDLDGSTMGTSWSARLVLPAGIAIALLQSRIQAVFDSVVAEMSNWEHASDISRFNRSAVGEWQPLPPSFMTVLRAGLDVANRSDGAFDPAIGALVDHWGFGPTGRRGRAGAAPNAWRNIEIIDDTARRTTSAELDFSGIAKGYAVDAVAEALMSDGITDFLIEAGGELRGEGVKPDGQPWWVDLEPVPGLAMPVTRVALCGLAAATSGDYRRFRHHGAIRDSHSIDPRAGTPIHNNVASVTVLHPSAMLADAWATALTVLGQDAGMALAGRENLAAIMVTRTENGAIEALSPAFSAMLG